MLGTQLLSSGCCIMVLHQPSKLRTGVRFPSPAHEIKNHFLTEWFLFSHSRVQTLPKMGSYLVAAEIRPVNGSVCLFSLETPNLSRRVSIISTKLGEPTK